MMERREEARPRRADRDQRRRQGRDRGLSREAGLRLPVAVRRPPRGAGRPGPRSRAATTSSPSATSSAPRFGPDVLARRTMDKVRGPSVIDSIRNPREVEFLRRQEGFVLVAVDAPIEIRFARTRARGRDESAATLEEFRAKEQLEMAGDETGQQLARCMAMADRTHRQRRDDRGAPAESGGMPMTNARVSKDDYYLGIAGEVAQQEHLLPAGHRGHHRPRRPDRLDGLRRRPAQDQGQPDPRLLPPGPARHPPRPALRALPERPRRAERHHQRRPGRRQPPRRRYVHLRPRRHDEPPIDAFPCFICKKMIINAGLRPRRLLDRGRGGERIHRSRAGSRTGRNRTSSTIRTSTGRRTGFDLGRRPRLEVNFMATQDPIGRSRHYSR